MKVSWLSAQADLDTRAFVPGLKIAIVHDWLVTYAGSERVLEQLLLLFPQADLFAVVDFLSPQDRTFLQGRKVSTTFIQGLPMARKHYRSYLPLMPLAIEQLDMSGYDLVISSSHAVAKGVITGPEQLHVSYVHSPVRYAWDLQHQYLRESGLSRGARSWIARSILHYIRSWDIRTAVGVDAFIANSQFVARRIEKTYRRDSTVIYPPVDIGVQAYSPQKEEYYLAASRMVPYKRMPLIIEAFNQMPDKKLVVVGDGPDFGRAKAIAKSNVELLGYQSTPVLRDLMQRARAFVFAAEEDFGIAPVEAQACGTPVIAYGRGGATETVLGLGSCECPTGIFFPHQTFESIKQAVEKFEENQNYFSPSHCRHNAQRFSPQRFQSEMSAFIQQQIAIRKQISTTAVFL